MRDFLLILLKTLSDMYCEEVRDLNGEKKLFRRFQQVKRTSIFRHSSFSADLRPPDIHYTPLLFARQITPNNPHAHEKMGQ